MDIVQVTRRIVDQQVRPGQRAGTTVAGTVPQAGAMRGSGKFLKRVAADGTVRESGVYGRARYGRSCRSQV